MKEQHGLVAASPVHAQLAPVAAVLTHRRWAVELNQETSCLQVVVSFAADARRQQPAKRGHKGDFNDLALMGESH